jgi:hypothetical protein
VHPTGDALRIREHLVSSLMRSKLAVAIFPVLLLGFTLVFQSQQRFDFVVIHFLLNDCRCALDLAFFPNRRADNMY